MNRLSHLTIILVSILFILPVASAVTQNVQFSYTGYHTWYSNVPFSFPDITYLENGINKTLILKDTPQNVSIDLNSAWIGENPFFGANEFWTVNDTGSVIIADEVIIISYSQYDLCSDPDPAVNAAQGCIGSSTAVVFGESIGMPMLFMFINVILFIAIFARTESMLMSSIVFIIGSIITIASFSEGLLRIALIAFMLGISAIVYKLLRKPGT